MTEDEKEAEQVQELLATPDLANVLESRKFRRFLDKIPIAIAVSDLDGSELIAYANSQFERVTEQAAAEIEGKPWAVVRGRGERELTLAEAVVRDCDYVGTFRVGRDGQSTTVVDAYSNVIQDDNGTAVFRFVALVDVSSRGKEEREALERRIRDKDLMLREIQHRVKNNLQMITALIRLESRNKSAETAAPFDRLAGRIESLSLLYSALSGEQQDLEVDLGVYLSQIAAAVMRTHAVEGIRLDLKVDAYPVSVNVAMPTGLVVNELLTNALKHAFIGRESGTITLHSLADANGCRIVVADDGVGFPDDMEWPRPGKLSALIVQSLRENAKARCEVKSTPQQGTRVTIHYTRAAAAPG
jgi:two-component sensor histidine kinase